LLQLTNEQHPELKDEAAVVIKTLEFSESDAAISKCKFEELVMQV
jgi:hypothetical protein